MGACVLKAGRREAGGGAGCHSGKCAQVFSLVLELAAAAAAAKAVWHEGGKLIGRCSRPFPTEAPGLMGKH